MDVTMQMIADHLSQKYTVLQYGHFTEQPLDWPEINLIQGLPKPCRVYVFSEQELPGLPKFPPSCMTICAGKCKNPLYFEGDFPFLEVNAQFPELFNTILGLYRNLEQWERTLSDILNGDANIEAMIQASLPVFGNAINLVDRKWNLMLMGLVDQAEHLMTKGDVSCMPLDADSIKNIQERIRNNGYDFTPRFCNDYIEQDLCCIDIFCEKQHVFSLGIIGAHRKLRPGDAVLLKTLAYYIEKAYQRRSTILETYVYSRREIVKQLLDGQAISDQEFYDAFSNEPAGARTEQSGQYICFRIIYVKEASQPYYNLCARLEALLPGCTIVEYANALVGILNFDIFPYSKSNYFEVMETQLKELGLCAGISRIFMNHSQLTDAYRQSCAALSTAKALHKSGHLFRFEELAFPYMLQQCTGGFSIDTFCGSGLRTLWEGRNDGKTNSWNILCTYLDMGGNASETARVLYMHRTTFLKRLSKIEQILQIDLGNTEQRLLIQLLVQRMNLFGLP